MRESYRMIGGAVWLTREEVEGSGDMIPFFGPIYCEDNPNDVCGERRALVIRALRCFTLEELRVRELAARIDDIGWIAA